MKGILINPMLNELVELQLENDQLETVYKAMTNDQHEVSIVQEVPIVGTRAVILVDEEGLFKQGLQGFYIRGFPEPLFGNALVLGSERDGWCDSPLSVSDVRGLLSQANYITTGMV